MNLQTVKQLATLKAQAGPLRRQAAERLALAVEQAKADAIAEFKNHFTRGGFAVAGESKRYVASFEGMQFILGIADARHLNAVCEFSITPPVAIGEPKLTVGMMRKNSSALQEPIEAGDNALIRHAERELSEARTMLSSSMTEFCFTPIADEPSEAVAPAEIRVFNTFSEFLSNSYPQ